MAVFGFPVAHEDDALRAVLAASEMRLTLAALNVDLKHERPSEALPLIQQALNLYEQKGNVVSAGGALCSGSWRRFRAPDLAHRVLSHR